MSLVFAPASLMKWSGLLATTVAMGVLAGGCAFSSESASRDALSANVGVYPPPPANAPTPRVGVPPFAVNAGEGFSGGNDLEGLAADQMTTLLDATERFQVVERTQLEKLLDEQNLEGIVRPGEMAQSAQVRGVDYLLLGKVTNLRVKREEKSTGFGLAQVGGLVGGADVKRKQVVLTTEAGVDIRLVDPTTGDVVMSNFSEFNRTDTAGAFGLDILGANAEADASIEIDEDDKGKILRLALDDAVKKSLPKIDRFLASLPAETDSAASATASPAGQASALPESDAKAKKFCPECGKEVAAGAKFCPVDGTKIQ